MIGVLRRGLAVLGAVGLLAGTVTTGAEASAGAVPHVKAAAAEPDRAVLNWRLTQLRSRTDGALEMSATETADESGSVVSLSGCSSISAAGISSYRWSFSDGTPAATTTKCMYGWKRKLSPTEKAVTVTLTTVGRDGKTQSTTQTVRYKDVVIASLGDSAASGQGASDGGTTFNIHNNCYRSGWAASAQAALRLQHDLGTNVTVHFWFLACSGASITAADTTDIWGVDPLNAGGLLDPYSGGRHQGALPPQVQRLRELITQSGLNVDKLLLTVGANDLQWAGVAEECLTGGGLLDVLGRELFHRVCLDAVKPKIRESISVLPAHFDALENALRGLVPNDRVYLNAA